MGLSLLTITSMISVALMLILFLLSHVVLHYGLLPLSASLALPGFSKPLFYLLILPGTIIHECSHFLACRLTMVRVFKAELFNPKANGIVGQVVYEHTDPIRRNIIAFAPFLGGSLALYMVMALVLPGGHNLNLSRLFIQPNDLPGSLATALTTVWAIIATADLTRPSTWLFFYLVFSVGYGIAPSRTDLSHLLADGLLVAGVSLSLYLLDSYGHLGLLRSDLVNALAVWLAGLLHGLNALLLFSVVIIGLGSLILVPVALLLYGLRGP